MKKLMLLAVLAVAGQSMAVLTVNITEAGGLNSPARDLGRTYLAGYENVAMTGDAGPLEIIGVRFKTTVTASSLPVGGSWPAAPITFSNYTMVLGTPSTQFTTAGEFLNTTSTFASWSNGLSTVKSGALTMGAGFWQLGQWTPAIMFDTPFAYDNSVSPGLLFGFQHSGATGGAGSVGNAWFPAAVGSFVNWNTGSTPGADAISSTVAGTPFSSAPNGFTSPMIVEFITQNPVPEPASMIAVTVGALALLRRRKKTA